MTDVKKIKKLDENVINKIAAGEIIQRPANAIKELLENSLDAQSNQIIISIKQGGLAVIQIQDNGCGICKDDFPLLCEKFTTSKLQEFHDLLTIATFGFRGEALASITHVAHVQITSKTADSPCAYKASFRDCKLLDSPKPCAGNTGTIVRVEDLFYNIKIRKDTLKSAREEYSKINEVVANYAIVNAHKCSITLKRIDDNVNASPDVRIQAGTPMDDCIVELYGSELSKQLLQITHQDDMLGYSLSGRVSKPSYNSRKFQFVLFINHRLVHCCLLKKCVETVYGHLLPKHTFPFIFLHLELPAKNVDVNVHPTKYEVHFLHQEVILASIKEFIEKTVSSSSESRSFPTQSLLNRSFSSHSSTNTSLVHSPRPFDKIRVDPKQQKIKSFLSSSELSKSTSSRIPSEKPRHVFVKTENVSQQTASIFPESEPCQLITISTITPDKSQCQPIIVPIKESPSIKRSACKSPEKQRKSRKIDLSTLEDLRKSIDTTGICDWRKFVYVGLVDHDRILVQRDKDLLLLNTPIVNYNLFYQLCLSHFGNFGRIELIDDDCKENGTNHTLLKDLFVFGLRETGKLYEGVDPDEKINMLRAHSDMLLDYFSIDIDTDTMMLLTIPLVLDKFIPDLRRLPRFIVSLCTNINWADEKLCLQGICREIAEFYAYGIGSKTAVSAEKVEYESVIEDVLLPMYRSFLRIPVSFEQDGTLVKLTSLPDLYNVFERC